MVLLGPTGAGKTTTLRTIAGLERPDAGRVSIGGHDVTSEPPAVRDVAFVFQQYSLYPHLTVYDNLAFPLRSPARRLPEDEVQSMVHRVAELLHIESKLQNRATRLSGGEMQRVAIGRALVRAPAIYLMDEPLSSLDAKLRAELRLELKRIQSELGATILYVTHDQIEAMTMASRIGILSDGALVQIGTPREVYERPANTYVAAHLGTPAINLIPAGLLPTPSAPPGTHTIGARTEQLRIGHALNGAARGVLKRVEHLGDQNHLHLEIAGHSLITLADPHARWKAGDTLSIELVDPTYFDATGRRIVAQSER
jgi:multiple sugar transport system ATP-binding protein